MRVKVRAVVWVDGKLIVASQLRQGHERLSLPGGLVEPRESIPDALVREVNEETGLVVEPGPLLYVAEVVQSARIQELELIFRAEPAGVPRANGFAVVDLRTGERPQVRPPILNEIAHDDAEGYVNNPRWLGNLWSRRYRSGPASGR